MTSLETPKTWIPYVNSRDCSQGFCSLYCPQWCYIIFPPPPPPKFDEFPDIDNSTPTFSPLMIAIIGILASAVLLITYYTIISKYCGKSTNDSRITRNQENQEEGIDEEIDQNHNPSIHEPWIVSSIGLDEALIKKITMFKYKKGDGLIEGTDCSVCLNEFQEDESLRLLPKCSHAFHVSCIDTWLKSHCNCPLCRANIVFISSSLPHNPPSPVVEGPQANSVQEDRPSSGSDVVIEIGDDERRLREQRVRRSYSMDNPCFERRASIADVLRMNDEDEELSSSEEGGLEVRKSGSRRKRRGLNGVMSPISMKRSFSSGRFFLSGRAGRVRDSTITMCIV